MAKSPATSFQQNWEKAVAWADSQGIDPKTISSVYSYDNARVQSGDFPMSAAERNRALIAANNPNDVTPNPVDAPNPVSVIGNARNDLRSILTGLEPQHIVGGLFSAIKNTVEDIADPAKVFAHGGKGIGAALENTVAAFVPGAYDVGEFLSAGGGQAGVDAVAEHPLVGLLDLLPADKAVTGAVLKAGDAALDGSVAARLGVASDKLGSMGPLTALTKAIGTIETKRWGAAIGPGGTALTQALTVGDVVTQWMGKTSLATNRYVRQLYSAKFNISLLNTEAFRGLMAPFLDATKGLSDQQSAALGDMVLQQYRDGKLQDQILAEATDPQVKAAYLEMMRNPLRWISEEEQGAERISPHIRPDDNARVFYATMGPDHPEINDLRDQVNKKLGVLAPHAARITGAGAQMDDLDAKAKELQPMLAPLVANIRARAGTDEELLKNITERHKAPGARKKENLYHGTRKQSVEALSGTVEALSEALQAGRHESVESLAKVALSRMRGWAQDSVEIGQDRDFQHLASVLGQIEIYGKERNNFNAALRKQLVGEHEQTVRASNWQYAFEERDRRNMEDRHSAARKEQTRRRTQDKSDIKNFYTQRRTKMIALAKQIRASSQTREAIDAKRLEQGLVDARRKQGRYERSRILPALQRTLENLKIEQKLKTLESDKKWDAEDTQLEDKIEAEANQLADQHEASRSLRGEIVKELAEYSDLIDKYFQALHDHPSDNLSGVHMQAYQKALLEHYRRQEAVGHLSGYLGRTEDRMAALEASPEVLGQLIANMVEDVVTNKDAWDPELVSLAREMRDDATTAANEMVHTYPGDVTWFPLAGPYDTPASAIQAMAGKGEPSVDAALQRVKHLNNTRYDVVAGVSKAVRQGFMQRAMVELMDFVRPYVLSGHDVLKFIASLPAEVTGSLESFDPDAETIPAHLTKQMERMGLSVLDQRAAFGARNPSWSGKVQFMPTSLYKALTHMHDQDIYPTFNAFDKVRNVYMGSILGLSPRYTAHVTFGGTMMLAARSSTQIFNPVFWGKTIRAMRDGEEIPLQVFQRPGELGTMRFSDALETHQRRQGHQLPTLLAQEDLAKQGHKLSEIKPVQWVRALADINYRFTERARRMQQAAAYMDYATRAEKRDHYIDEYGDPQKMTKARAMQEGINHVYAIYGDLGSRTPLERGISRYLFPFYSWQTHMLKYILTMPIDHPWRAMSLGLIGYENSNNVPPGLFQRIQFLFFLGSPDKNGNVNALNLDFLDPFRDVGNYASLSGWIEALNPVAQAAEVMAFGPSAVYGQAELYPNLTYDQFYGIEVAGNQSSLLGGAEQIIPQLGAAGAMVDAMTQSGSYLKQAKTDPGGFAKTVFQDLNVPFADPQQLNLKVIAAKTEDARYNVARAAATNAFNAPGMGGSAIEQALSGFSSVPNPLNPDYEITPEQLQAIYNEALAAFPGQLPSNVLVPPRTPPGYQ